MSQYLFTSESVAAGHPDKVADQLSDAVLDAIMAQDANCRVACEVIVKTGMVLLAGEITTSAWVDIEELARKVIRKIGYTDPHLGFDADSCAVLSAIGKQSPDIARGVDITTKHTKQGAGDQGLMFGYATNETPELMPAALMYAHQLMERQALVLHSNTFSWLRPDGKSQVTVRYEDEKPIGIETVVLSTQHTDEISHHNLKEAVIEEIIKPVLPEQLLKKTNYLINPTGRFVVGGPKGDTGLTGRKIIVDTYGGAAHHGGGCFSGKDPSKVDRSAAYMGRYIAKNIVAAKLADKCEIQVAYAIGVAEPVSIRVNTFGTGKIGEDKLVGLIHEHFDLTPHGIITTLDLLRPIYYKTAAFGHFGRNDPSFTWERIDKAKVLREKL